MGRLGPDAGDLGEGFKQFALDPAGVIVEVLLRPLGAGLHRPALDDATPRFAGLARQPGDAVVGAARRVPLRA